MICRQFPRRSLSYTKLILYWDFMLFPCQILLLLVLIFFLQINKTGLEVLLSFYILLKGSFWISVSMVTMTSS